MMPPVRIVVIRTQPKEDCGFVVMDVISGMT